MVTKKLLRLVQELLLVLLTSMLIPSFHLSQYFVTGRFSHGLVHAPTVTATFGATNPLTPSSQPSRVAKLLAQFVRKNSVIWHLTTWVFRLNLERLTYVQVSMKNRAFSLPFLAALGAISALAVTTN